MKIATLLFLVAAVSTVEPEPQFDGPYNTRNLPVEITEFRCTDDQTMAEGRLAEEIVMGNVRYRLLLKLCADI